MVLATAVPSSAPINSKPAAMAMPCPAVRTFVATTVATKVLTAGQGIAIAAGFELIGALLGTAVAKTIGQGLVDTNYITMTTIMCALLGGIIWNLATWWLGLPSSSSHALMGGLCGAAVASAGDWSVVKFEGMRNKV